MGVSDCLSAVIQTFGLTSNLTGDKPLRKAANKEGVVVYGTIWIYDQLKNLGKISEDDYDSAIADLITAVQNGRCRLPLDELFKRKRP